MCKPYVHSVSVILLVPLMLMKSQKLVIMKMVIAVCGVCVCENNDDWNYKNDIGHETGNGLREYL